MWKEPGSRTAKWRSISLSLFSLIQFLEVLTVFVPRIVWNLETSYIITVYSSILKTKTCTRSFKCSICIESIIHTGDLLHRILNILLRNAIFLIIDNKKSNFILPMSPEKEIVNIQWLPNYPIYESHWTLKDDFEPRMSMQK